MNWLLVHLGIVNESGRYYAFWSGFGSDIAEIAIVGGLIDMTRRMVRHHRERLAQSAAQHKELVDQSERHHRAHLLASGKQHVQVLDRLDAHHDALRQNLSKGFGQVIAQADANAQRAADGPAKGEPGSNPGSEGLKEDGPAVPPPAARKPRARAGGEK